MALPLRSLLKNRYLIGRILGSGGFGITYLAWDQTLEVAMAIKEYMPVSLAARNHEDASVIPNSKKSQKPFHYYMSKFLEEARTLAKLNDEKGIVSVQDVFKEHGTIYIVMYYVSGISLEAYLEKSGGRLQAQESLQIMTVIMTALTKVHKKGLIHRDISPDNIYMTHDHEVKLLDFGAARYTLGQGEKTLSIILKRGYAPLEQYLEKGIQGAWTDVYSVGATLYKLLTGKKPKEALDRMDGDSLKSPKALGADISYKIDLAIMKALALKPEDRFQTMEDFLSALKEEDKITRVKKANYRKVFSLALLSFFLVFSQTSSVEYFEDKALDFLSESHPWSDNSSPQYKKESDELIILSLEDLQGRNFEKAVKIYSNFGISIEASEYVHNPLHQENIILDQFPPMGSKLKSGDRVKVVISKGPIHMPDFKDKSLEVAKAFAGEKGLNLVDEYVAYESHEPGTIIDQRPEVDSILSDQVSIDLILDKDTSIVADDEKPTDYRIGENPIDISGDTIEEIMDQKQESQEEKTLITSKDKETERSLTGQKALYLVLESYELTSRQLKGKFAFNHPLTDAEKKTMGHGGRILSLGDDPIEVYLFTFYADVEGNFLVNFKQVLDKAAYHIEEMTYNLKLPFEVK